VELGRSDGIGQDASDAPFFAIGQVAVVMPKSLQSLLHGCRIGLGERAELAHQCQPPVNLHSRHRNRHNLMCHCNQRKKTYSLSSSDAMR
jgi:hypothetical protein